MSNLISATMPALEDATVTLAPQATRQQKDTFTDT
jgi:hypothetical protein